MDVSKLRSNIGKKIRELRESKNWSQQELAAELARVLGRKEPFSAAAISRYEDGKRSVKPEMIEVFSRIFDVQPSAIYSVTRQVAEEKAVYGGENAVRVPILSVPGESFPFVAENEVEGYAEFPRFLFPGARFLIKLTAVEIKTKDISRKDYCVLSTGGKQWSGGKVLVKSGRKFVVTESPSKEEGEPVARVIGVLKSV
ncbi:MAG: helix-turn-helix transcriptional regulator [Endomicrobiales bacterium]|nr:helix-turn-helix transcriptional regulator [Endomicrobiales bacterium]